MKSRGSLAEAAGRWSASALEQFDMKDGTLKAKEEVQSVLDAACRRSPAGWST
ncbi:hypothetical protein ACFV9E_36670 [Streptomyces sp. NPDC059835]|uniref:hypothetical protein n=1 Tax=Streptomyces sp. NPDC059835 TaxID=3346967 RepID=UPI003647121B